MNRYNRMYELEKIFEIVLAFSDVSDRTILLNIILTNMMEITASDAGTLYIVDDQKLHFNIIQNKTLGIFESRDRMDEQFPPVVLDENNIQNVSAYSAINNEVVIVDDVSTDLRFNFAGLQAYDQKTGYTTKAMFVLPLYSHREDGGEVLGVLQLINPIDHKTNEVGKYSDLVNRDVVLNLAKIAASTLANLSHVAELQMFLRSFAAAMTQAIDERSHYNSSHTQNVAQYSEAFSKYLSSNFPKGHKFHFNDFHIESITLAALLHDIGKVIIPLQIMDKSDRLSTKLEVIRYRFGLKKLQLRVSYLETDISEKEYLAEKQSVDDLYQFIEQINDANFLTKEQLDKVSTLGDMTYLSIDGHLVNLFDKEDINSLSIQRGTLTAEERKTMEEHVNITSRLLAQIPFRKYYSNVPEWAACHHEFLDGSGYPVGLKGDQIPIESCIITIMDVFDALIDTNRPYKKGVTVDTALNILDEMADAGKLHKELVTLFIKSKIWTRLSRF